MQGKKFFHEILLAGEFTRLTPGDFATVRKRLQWLDGEAQAENILELLKKECLLKPDASNGPAGFLNSSYL
jgi:hypothetical protein